MSMDMDYSEMNSLFTQVYIRCRFDKNMDNKSSLIISDEATKEFGNGPVSIEDIDLIISQIIEGESS